MVDREDLEYELFAVCRKRPEEPEKRRWSRLREEIAQRAEQVLAELEASEQELTPGDTFVVALGKCLELYSRHYPRVAEGGQTVDAAAAVEEISELVDAQQLQNRFQQLAEKFDRISAAYLAYVASRKEWIVYSTLQRQLQFSDLDIDELLEAGLVERQGGTVRVLAPEERAEALEELPSSERSHVDRAHYLYHLGVSGRNVGGMAEAWTTHEAIQVMRVLAEVTREEARADKYAELADNLDRLAKWWG
jgi:hypothetical protein